MSAVKQVTVEDLPTPIARADLLAEVAHLTVDRTAGARDNLPVDFLGVLFQQTDDSGEWARDVLLVADWIDDDLYAAAVTYVCALVTIMRANPQMLDDLECRLEPDLPRGVIALSSKRGTVATAPAGHLAELFGERIGLLEPPVFTFVGAGRRGDVQAAQPEVED